MKDNFRYREIPGLRLEDIPASVLSTKRDLMQTYPLGTFTYLAPKVLDETGEWVLSAYLGKEQDIEKFRTEKPEHMGHKIIYEGHSTIEPLEE